MFVYNILVFLEGCAEILHLRLHGSCWPAKLETLGNHSPDDFRLGGQPPGSPWCIFHASCYRTIGDMVTTVGNNNILGL